MDYLLQCDHITKKVGNFLLQDIHFELEPGYILGVIGKNGAGKSTLVRVLLGSLKLYNYQEDYRYHNAEGQGMAANKGDVILNGASIKRDSNTYKEQLAYILNDSPFTMELSAKDNGRLYGNYYKKFDYKRYQELCGNYEVPYELPLKKLSKGEQIKQQLAFSLSYDAKLYVFDEPAGNLDVRFRDEFYDIMRGIVEDGMRSVIYVTHLVEEMETLADYVLWIEDGQQKGYGSMEGLMDTYLLYDGPKDLLDDKQLQIFGKQLQNENPVKKNQHGTWNNPQGMRTDTGKYRIVGIRERESHFEALLFQKEGKFPETILKYGRRATLKEIMYYAELRELQSNEAIRDITKISVSKVQKAFCKQKNE